MNKTYIFYIVLIALAVVGYFYIGEIAFGILGAAIFGGNPKQKAKDAIGEADKSNEQVDVHLAESARLMEEAKQAHDDATRIADEITVPKDDKNLPPGFKRKSISSE